MADGRASIARVEPFKVEKGICEKVSLGEGFVSFSLLLELSRARNEGESRILSRRAFGAPRDEIFEMETEGARKLRKSAANPLK